MPIIETNEGKFYAYEDKGNANRTAEMYFNKQMQPGSKWKFRNCDYTLLQGGKSIEDWMFLKEIGQEIEKRLIELNEKEEEIK